MCGLVAVMSMNNNGFTNDELAMLEQSMIFNQLRGDDSTGVVAVTRDDKWSYIKTENGWPTFRRHARWPDMRHKILYEGRLAFGHGRWATRGVVNKDNAHPFHLENKEKDKEIVFMHNGTLEAYQNLQGLHSYNVDSEWLGAMINEHGAEKALSEIYGAMACLWWDAKENTFNFYRNDDRPLYYMSSKKGEFYINSEKWILDHINSRFKLGIAQKSIYLIKDLDLHSVHVNGPKHGQYDIKHLKKARRYVPPVAPVVRAPYDSSSTYGGYSGHGYNHYSDFCPQEDKGFWNREIESIEWLEDTRTVLYRDKTKVTYLNDPPPELGLLRMYEIKSTGDVMKVFKGSHGGPPMYVVSKYNNYKEKKSNLEAIEMKSKSDRKDILRFTTRLMPQNIKVKHFATILKGKEHPHLEAYSNSVDGEAKVGEEVQVEVLYIEETMRGSKVFCSRIKERQDSYIDYVFNTDMRKAEVDQVRFFSGTIGAITLQNKQEMSSTGAYVLCGIFNVKGISTEPEVAARVEAPKQNTSVH